MVTGLGGIFIKANDPRYLARWYEDNLGIGFGNTLYFSFKWRELSNPDSVAHTVLSFFNEDTTYFYPGTNDVMLNFRVNNLDDLRITLRNNGAQVIDKIENYEYGRFGWALDPAGNKIELWEPDDNGFEDRNKPMRLTGVTGLNGINLKTPKTDKLADWYATNLGLFFSSRTHSFESIHLTSGKKQSLSLTFYPEDSSYFSPGEKSYMLSFRVEDIQVIIQNLISSGHDIIGKISEYQHGLFAWFLDPEGNKVELAQID